MDARARSLGAKVGLDLELGLWAAGTFDMDQGRWVRRTEGVSERGESVESGWDKKGKRRGRGRDRVG